MTNQSQRTSFLHRLSTLAFSAVSTFFINLAVAFDPSPEPDVISLDDMYRELHFDLWEKELT